MFEIPPHTGFRETKRKEKEEETARLESAIQDAKRSGRAKKGFGVFKLFDRTPTQRRTKNASNGRIARYASQRLIEKMKREGF